MNYKQENTNNDRLQKAPHDICLNVVDKFEALSFNFKKQVEEHLTFDNSRPSFFSRFKPARYRSSQLRKMMGEMREDAYKSLLQEVERLSSSHEKLELLTRAKKLAIFKMHRNYFCFFGAFKRTATVAKIDALIEKLTQDAAHRLYR